MLTKEKVLEALRGVEDPELRRSVVELNMVRNIKIDGDRVSLDIILTIQGCPLKAKIEDDIMKALKEIGASHVDLRFGSMTDKERAELAAQLRGGQSQQPHQAISPLLAEGSKTTFIAVTSGKGGVGKSTVSANLAVSLARLGKKVGIIDADIYGFSIPDMMGIEQRPTVLDQVILPVERHGVKVISMGFFVEDNSPIIWRGPLLGKMLRNFFTEVHWGELDYMILDLPPGTGDVALDVHTLIPQSKEIIVTTPHATAAFVAARAGAMAMKTNHEIIGVVENMAYFQCEGCERKEYIFGRGGGAKLAEQLRTELLAQIPIGQPETHPQEKDFSPSIYKPETTIGGIYMELAKKVAER
ncbi:Mrp/NBP35 family ATP-binding protein [Microaerobacter geothermalis]|uniref:Mrp/NBP35 family ATP-binding protein n=1 Tax=Microaerobacter geothermalis TaxID=674972 RepID=UPI001F2BF20C|nr:Mrp/NBP35 family ATP-binding protein [Microaerobacter geothermalis]MCF6095282.1 Mrp/NBP35 family ATP-binding protein [Microaerobacter geothermalis]